LQYRASKDVVFKQLYEYMSLKDRQDMVKSNMDFFEYQGLLQYIFWSKTNPQINMFPEMSKQSFCKVLEESGVLKLPKIEETKKATTTKGKDSKKAAQEEAK
jgi:hypothetical protein